MSQALKSDPVPYEEAAPGVNARLAELQAERDRSWSADALRINAAQRRTLVETFDPATALQAGDVFPSFSLESVAGGHVTLASLVARGPAVILFFRFAGCPACNVALPAYDELLFPELARLAVPLAAISPQPVQRLAEIKERHALRFPVLCDEGNGLGRTLGILYHYDQDTRAASESKGVTPEFLNGTAHWELPMPAAFVVDGDRRIQLARIGPDWMVRAEADEILSVVSSLL